MKYFAIEKVAKKIRKEPDPVFKKLTADGRKARVRGYFTRAEFLRICRWKSRRRIALCLSNSKGSVEKLTAIAFTESDEISRIEALLKLSGVAVPTASALLAVSDPSSYGVVDIRAWQFLHSVGAVTRNKRGTNLSVKNWLQYLSVLRKVALRIKTTPRLVEISLYNAHKATQKGALYQSHGASSPSLKRTSQKPRFCRGVIRNISFE